MLKIKREDLRNAGWGKHCVICGQKFNEGICDNRHEQGEEYIIPTKKSKKKGKGVV